MMIFKVIRIIFIYLFNHHEKLMLKKGIAVDTHVHRISNRLNWVKTKSPDETKK